MTRHLPAVAVQRAVFAAGLAACVSVVFVAVREISTYALHRVPGAGAWLLATVLVALLVPAARPLVERVAERAAYGSDGDPYAVMSRFVREVTDAIAVDDVLPQLARAGATALHAPRGEARLWLDDGSEWRQTWPPDVAALTSPVSLALRHDGRDVGRLGVDVGKEDLSPTDRAILDRLAGPAGVALANVRLTYELRRQITSERRLADQLWHSRQRLLDAAAEQQARFGQAVAHRVQARLDEASRALSAAEHGEAAGLETARDDVQQALDSLRALAVGVFPPVLAERGLVAALQMHLEEHPDAGVVVDEEVEQQAADFSPELAATAYFCSVALLDGTGGDLRLSCSQGCLQILVTSPVPPDPATVRLVRDRVEAADGEQRQLDGDCRQEVLIQIPPRPGTDEE
ncbi:MAG: hypothetical protein ACLGIA_05500 [Actinomycetes bacterium]